jgi:hypothetical protein
MAEMQILQGAKICQSCQVKYQKLSHGGTEDTGENIHQ